MNELVRKNWPPDRELLFWTTQAGAWTFTGVLGAFVAVNWGIESADAVLLSLVRGIIGFFITGFGVRLVLRRLFVRRVGAVEMIGCIVFIGGVASCLDWALSLLAVHLGEMNFAEVGPQRLLWLSIVLRWPLYSVWGLLYWLQREWQKSREAALRLAEMEAVMARTELDLLRAQIDPHFVFNVLNTIVAVADKPEAVTTMTLALSKHLEFSLKRAATGSSLESELAAVENYLRIEKFRFEESLLFTIDADPALFPMPLPPGTLLLPVENAIKYGRKTSPSPLRVEISARTVGREVLLNVSNTGSWVSSRTGSRPGIGLANLRKTLEHFGGSGARPEVACKDGWVRVAIHLPNGEAS